MIIFSTAKFTMWALSKREQIGKMLMRGTPGGCADDTLKELIGDVSNRTKQCSCNDLVLQFCTRFNTKMLLTLGKSKTKIYWCNLKQDDTERLNQFVVAYVRNNICCSNHHGGGLGSTDIEVINRFVKVQAEKFSEG